MNCQLDPTKMKTNQLSCKTAQKGQRTLGWVPLSHTAQLVLVPDYSQPQARCSARESLWVLCQTLKCSTWSLIFSLFLCDYASVVTKGGLSPLEELEAGSFSWNTLFEQYFGRPLAKQSDQGEMKKQVETLALFGIVPTQKKLHLCMEHLGKHKSALIPGKNKRQDITPKSQSNSSSLIYKVI